MEMHPHWDQVPSALPMAQQWLPWFSFSCCWSGQHHPCAGFSLTGVALSSFPWGLHGNCFLCTCPRAWPTSPTRWGCLSGPAHHLHWNLNPREMASQQRSPQRSGKPKTPVVTPVPRCRNLDPAWSTCSFPNSSIPRASSEGWGGFGGGCGQVPIQKGWTQPLPAPAAVPHTCPCWDVQLCAPRCAHPEGPGPLTFLGRWGASEELVGDVAECRELGCVPEDALGSLRLQQLQDRVGGQAPELHLHGSHRKPGHTPEHHAARGDDNRGTQKRRGAPVLPSQLLDSGESSCPGHPQGEEKAELGVGGDMGQGRDQR